MKVNHSKTVDVFFISTHHAGITSILNRMLFNYFIENDKKGKKETYQYEIYLDKNYIIFNFREQTIEGLKEFNPKNENIIIFVYSLDKSKPSISIEPIHEAIKDILKENYKNIKIGLIGNKLDLIKENNVKSVIENGRIYAEKIKAKFLLTSAKSGKCEVFHFIIDLLNLKLKKEIIKNKKSIIKEYEQLYKSELKNLSIILRCEICKTKIPKIIFHENSSKIELFCKGEHNEKFIYDYKNIMNLIDKKCIKCQKEYEEKNYNSFMYCKTCQNFICNKCSKNHEHNSDKNEIFPYYALDQLCCDHGIKNDICCLDCNSLICSFCYKNYHNTHNIKKVDNNFISEIIDEKRKALKKEKKELEKLNNFYLDLINELKKIYNEYIEKVNYILKLKENILTQLELIKYNNELYNTVLKMKFKENLNLDISNNLSFLDKFTKFFDFIGQPIQITKYNICNKNNKIKKFDLSTRNTIKDNEDYSNNLTDACNIDNDYFCISFDNGNIQIYNNKNFESYLKKYEIYDRKKGVNSIINYNNDNTLYVSGYEKIYKIKIIDKDLSITKETLINHPNTTFIKLCKYKFKQSLLYTDDLGNIGIYNFINKKDSNIVENLENFGINSIIDLYNINKNFFLVKYINYELKLLIKDNSLSLDIFSIMDKSNNEGIIDDKIEKSRELFKIFYLNEDNKMSDEKLFQENTKILGMINQDHILIQITNTQNQIQYKIMNFINNNELYFGNMLERLNKNLSLKLIGKNNDNGKIYFILVDQNLNIYEFSFIPESGDIQEIDFKGALTKNNSNIYNDKIVKIILVKRTLFIINRNCELFKMNY